MVETSVDLDPPPRARAQPVQVAIDFGISNTDAIAWVEGGWRRWTQAYIGEPDEAVVRAVLARGGLELEQAPVLAVTGGRHRLLPATLGPSRVVGVNELPAIGRGGQAALPTISRRTRVLVVSAGSGTAVVAAQGSRYRHITGTAVGGGTLLGLGRLLLKTVDPTEIDRLAMEGNANHVDLSLADVVTGPIGTLPATATAVNFGRLARMDLAEAGATRADMAAALVTLIGQVIGLLSIAAARALECDQIVIIGHMTDMASIRRVLELVSQYYSTPLVLPGQAGYYTALGALLRVAETRPTPEKSAV
jgi:type II pantothenate kinase